MCHKFKPENSRYFGFGTISKPDRKPIFFEIIPKPYNKFKFVVFII